MGKWGRRKAEKEEEAIRVPTGNPFTYMENNNEQK